MIHSFSRLLLFVALVFIAVSVHAVTGEPSLPEATEGVAVPVDILPTDAVFLGEAEDGGVLSMAYLYRTPTAAQGNSSDSTLPYILFLRFISAESQVKVEKGVVAYKIEKFDGVMTPAKKMDLRSGYFVAGIESPGRGRHLLHIGCKLEDDRKRQYRFALNF